MKKTSHKKLFVLLILIGFYFQKSVGQIITTYAGTGVTGFYGDGGPCDSAAFYYSEGICIDSLGNLYVADSHNNRIRKITTYGIISTIAGTGISGSSIDGTLAINAKLQSPTSIAIDKKGTIFIVVGNRVKKITPSGYLFTIAGNDSSNFFAKDVPATSAGLYSPTGLSLDKHGNIFFAEIYNNIVRKIDTSGVIHTVAGNSSCQFGCYFSGDGGPATSAGLYFPSSTYVDKHDNLYIADFANSRIRKVDTTGYISTIAGTGSIGFSGDGGISSFAQLHYPGYITGDENNNLYISDSYNYRIRKIDSGGIINTIAGTGTGGFSGDGGNPLNAKLGSVAAIALKHNGDILISDNNRIRLITYGTIGLEEIKSIPYFNIYPNPNNGQFIFESDKATGIMRIINTLGQCVFSSAFSDYKNQIDLQGISSGIYTIQIINESTVLNKIFVIN